MVIESIQKTVNSTTAILEVSTSQSDDGMGEKVKGFALNESANTDRKTIISRFMEIFFIVNLDFDAKLENM
jgi:hypothetical protein